MNQFHDHGTPKTRARVQNESRDVNRRLIGIHNSVKTSELPLFCRAKEQRTALSGTGFSRQRSKRDRLDI